MGWGELAGELMRGFAETDEDCDGRGELWTTAGEVPPPPLSAPNAMLGRLLDPTGPPLALLIEVPAALIVIEALRLCSWAGPPLALLLTIVGAAMLGTAGEMEALLLTGATELILPCCGGPAAEVVGLLDAMGGGVACFFVALAYDRGAEPAAGGDDVPEEVALTDCAAFLDGLLEESNEVVMEGLGAAWSGGWGGWRNA